MALHYLVNGVALPCLYQVTFGMVFPVATHVTVYEVFFSSKTWGDEGKDVVFGSSKIRRNFYTTVIVKILC